MKIGVVGARGYTGRELLGLIAGHAELDLVYAASGSAAGELVSSVAPEVKGSLRFAAPSPDAVTDLDAVVLALPNGKSADYLPAVDARTVVVDLSADHRFDDDWAYGLPERNRAALRGAKRIANPGCYATGVQLALGPVFDVVDDAVAFGVSGYSGAGTSPSRKNDPDELRGNLIPYGLVDHVHEREVIRHLGGPVRFHPHVAPWFRGISLTLSVSTALDADALYARLHAAYDEERLVDVREQVEVRDARNTDRCIVGGVTCAPGRAVLLSSLDNLRKGAATQAMQNINLGLGLGEFIGL